LNVCGTCKMLSINETRSRGGRNGDRDVESDTLTFVIHFAKILLAPTFRASLPDLVALWKKPHRCGS
jgi:hypothetical protein